MGKYGVDHFIEKFKGIHGNKWCTGVFFKGKRMCVYGHCGVRYGTLPLPNEAYSLRELFKTAYYCRHIPHTGPAACNDDHSDDYAPTPKKRILKALYAIRDAAQ